MAEIKKTVKKTTAKKSSPKKSSQNMEAVSQDKLQLNPFRMNVLPKKTKLTLLVLLVIVLIGVILFTNRGLFIASLVNGEPVSRFEVIANLEEQHGTEALNRLIDKKLILQTAERQNLNPTQEEINAKRKEIVDQISGGNEENFNQILTSQGLTQEEFHEELKIQVIAEKMLEDNVQVTDEEFNRFVENNPDLLENAEDKEAASSSLREQLRQEKLQTEYTKWIGELRAEADIVNFVNY